jgi:hypothetical protein
MIPLRIASVAACVPSYIPSLLRIFLTWFFIVYSAMFQEHVLREISLDACLNRTTDVLIPAVCRQSDDSGPRGPRQPPQLRTDGHAHVH